MGLYHYVSNGGTIAEVGFFVDSIEGCPGQAMLVIDWEGIENGAWQDEVCLEVLVAHVTTRTGIPPVVYTSASVFPWSVCERQNCGMWVAQYADSNPTGY